LIALIAAVILSLRFLRGDAPMRAKSIVAGVGALSLAVWFLIPALQLATTLVLIAMAIGLVLHQIATAPMKE
jgi:membrane protein CcdC involved in cytochrome C biogenesis